MARGINKVILVGNVGSDVEVKNMPSGGEVVQLSLATSRAWKDKDGVQQDHTEWHRVVFFGKLAEIVGKYVVKGSKLYCEGSLRTNKWQDKDGNDRYTTEVIAKEMQMLDSKGGSPDQSQSSSQQQSAPDVTQVDNGMDNFEDDIPF